MNDQQQNLKEIAFLAGVAIGFVLDNSEEDLPEDILKEASKHPELGLVVASDSGIISLAYKHLLNYAAMKESLKESNEIS